MSNRQSPEMTPYQALALGVLVLEFESETAHHSDAPQWADECRQAAAILRGLQHRAGRKMGIFLQTLADQQGDKGDNLQAFLKKLAASQ